MPTIKLERIIMLTNKEKNFLKNYSKLKLSYMLSFLVIVIICIFQFYILYYKYIPLYLKTFQGNIHIQNFIKLGLVRCSGFSLIWIFLLIGILFGHYYSFQKMNIILKKLNMLDGKR